MNRFVLIDQHSGFIWADAAQFGASLSPIELAKAADWENLESPKAYRFGEINDMTDRPSHLVYEVPADMPQITDGQDAEQIQAVMRLGRPVARIEW